MTTMMARLVSRWSSRTPRLLVCCFPSSLLNSVFLFFVITLVFFSFFRGTGVLVAMGIDESVARDTLAACDNNVSIAANRILDASS